MRNAVFTSLVLMSLTGILIALTWWLVMLAVMVGWLVWGRQ